MRSRLFAFGALFALLFQSAAGAQNIIPNRRPVEAPPAAVPVTPLGTGRGTTVAADAKLSPGDMLIIQILEDVGDPAMTKEIGDSGAVDLTPLGSVRISNMTVADAKRAIEGHLVANYYHKATVRLEIFKKNADTLPSSKVFVGGKVGRPGSIPYNPAVGMSLKEAIAVATTNLYSDLKKVKFTRSGVTREIDVDAIINKGRLELDVKLQDGDHIVVPAKGFVGFGN